MSPTQYKKLEELEKKLEASTKVAVMRKALKLMDTLTKNKKPGEHVVIFDQDGNQIAMLM